MLSPLISLMEDQVRALDARGIPATFLASTLPRDENARRLAAVRRGEYTLVYLVYNTIQNLTSQEDQVACFTNVARHLEAGGCFVIEVEVPPLRRLPPGQSALPFLVTPERVGFDTFDVARQRGVSHHYWAEPGRAGTFTVPYRYVWPAELDLMARIAGLRLRERWNGWRREPFTSESTSHVSVWEKSPEA